MFIDTHSHIQFPIFDQNRDQVIQAAANTQVEAIIAVGTDIQSSVKAIEIAEKYPSVYAAVGIHPHHVFAFVEQSQTSLADVRTSPETSSEILHFVQDKLNALIDNPEVVAIGETGLDAHPYPSTKYPNYKVTDEFLKLQEKFFIEQIKLAIQYQKTLIIHNRGMADHLLEILKQHWDPFLSGRSVFHCCEPNKQMLDFAKKRQVFIGVDGDVTYDKEKQSFVKEVPLELLVLETDSPFFVPEPLKSTGIKQNTPENITFIGDFLDKITHKNVQKMSRNNASALFKL